VRWTIHGERSLYESDWMNLRLVDVELPGGPRFEHHVVRYPQDAAGTVIVDPARGVLLLRRHRFVTDTWGWEIPAGRIDPGETAEQAAEREAVEETGWRPLDLERFGFSNPSIGLVDQRFNYFIARRAEHVGAFDIAETESIAWFAPDDVRTMIGQGEIPDGLSVTALGMAFALRLL
jgi:8-oxo-dGTP pyrophosphatase MutT (NUDIX family)